MERRLKFYGWGYENTGLSDAERERLFRFVADRLGVEPRLAPPPQAADIALRAPRIAPPAALAGVLTQDPYERLLHTYGKSYPETVRAFARDFANAPDLVALPESEADVAAVLDWASAREGRRHSVRRRLLGRRRRRAGGRRRLCRRGEPRSAPPRPRAGGRRDEPRRAHPGRHPRAGDRGGAETARPRHPALPAELRVLDARRLDRDALWRPFRHALHPYRRFRRKPPHDHAGRRDGVAPPARLGRGPEPRPHDDRLRGRARRDHRGVDAAAGTAALPRRRRLRLSRLFRRGEGRARGRASRALSLEPQGHRQRRGRRLWRERLRGEPARARLRVRRPSGRRVDGARDRAHSGPRRPPACRRRRGARVGARPSSACPTRAN